MAGPASDKDCPGCHGGFGRGFGEGVGDDGVVLRLDGEILML